MDDPHCIDQITGVERKERTKGKKNPKNNSRKY